MIDFDSFIAHLRSQLNDLPGEKAHATLMPINRPFTSEALERKPDYRKSAVALILFPEDEAIKSILIQRPDYNGTHGGQVSFPGGKMDDTDIDLEFTARREAFEEINLPIEAGNFLGKMSEIYIPPSNFLVEPNVFYVNELPELIGDEREVQSIITFNIFDLLHPDSFKVGDIRNINHLTRKNIPYFEIQEHKVWGATGMILAEMKEIILQIV